MLLKRTLIDAGMRAGLLALLLTSVPAAARAADPAEAPPPPAQSQAQDAKPTLQIYGFAQADAIADFKQINPDWYDVLRPSRLPNVANQFGEAGGLHRSALIGLGVVLFGVTIIVNILARGIVGRMDRRLGAT